MYGRLIDSAAVYEQSHGAADAAAAAAADDDDDDLATMTARL